MNRLILSVALLLLYSSSRANAMTIKLPETLRNMLPQKKDPEAVLSLLRQARVLGPVGTFRSSEEQKALLEQALALKPLSDSKPSRTPLEGIHDLVYSAAPGGSSGKLFGPIYGKVTQEFPDEIRFINSVQLGPVKLGLRAERQVKDDQ